MWVDLFGSFAENYRPQVNFREWNLILPISNLLLAFGRCSVTLFCNQNYCGMPLQNNTNWSAPFFRKSEVTFSQRRLSISPSEWIFHWNELLGAAERLLSCRNWRWCTALKISLVPTQHFQTSTHFNKDKSPSFLCDSIVNPSLEVQSCIKNELTFRNCRHPRLRNKKRVKTNGQSWD